MLCAQTVSPDDAIDGGDDSEQQLPPHTAAGAAPDYRNFTVTQRLGTYLLNGMIPGLGSYAVMRDIAGGTFQVGATGAQVFCMVAGTVFFAGKNKQWETGLIIAGAALAATNGIFNIVRSITYNKPQPRAGSLADLNAWSLAVLPGEDGIEQVHFAYTLRF